MRNNITRPAVLFIVNLLRLIRWLACLGGGIVSLLGGEVPPAAATIQEPVEGKGARLRRAIDGLLPTAWQRRPLVPFTAITEMTAEGRKRRVPTPEQPMYYHSPAGQFVQTGWSVTSGERPPPTAELQEVMQKALAANGYLPVGDNQRPEVLIIFNFGSHGTDPAQLAADAPGSPPTNAEELLPYVLSDPSLFRDVIARADFIGGTKFARELKTAMEGEVRNMNANRSISRGATADTLMALMPVSPDFGSPYQQFVRSGNNVLVERLAEMAFRTCYFVTASAFDFRGVESRQKIPLWQSRMAVDAQGVSLKEILQPLIVATTPFLGRDTPEPVVVTKQLNRDGRVEIGTPTVVEEAKPPGAAPESARKP